MPHDRSPFSTVTAPARLFRVVPLDHAGLFDDVVADDEQNALGIFDDDERRFRVAYVAASREGAYRKALVALRPSPELVAALIALEPDDDDEVDPTEGIGLVPMSWLLAHRLETLVLDGAGLCVNVVAENTLRALSALRQINIDAEDILREHTIARRLSRQIYAQAERFDGIAYPNRVGRPVEHFALFEGERGGVLRNRELGERTVETITVDDPALIDVVNEFRLRIPGYAERGAVGSPLVWHERLALVIAEQGLVGEPLHRDDAVAFWTLGGRCVVANRAGERVQAFGVVNGHLGQLDVGSANLSISTSMSELGRDIAAFLKGVDALAKRRVQQRRVPPNS